MAVTKKDVEDVLDFVHGLNEMMMKDSNGAPTLIALQRGNNRAVVEVPPYDDETKPVIFAAMNATLRKIRPDLAVFTSECWVVRALAGEYDKTKRPSEHPNRIEMVCEIGQWRGGTIMRSYPILEVGPVRFLGGLEQEIFTEAMDPSQSTHARIFKGVFEEVGHS